MTGMRLHHSNRMEALAVGLVRLMRADPGDPFAPERVVVPHPTIGRWLLLELARGLGIAANVRIEQPAEFAWSIMREAVPELPKEPTYAPAWLRWRIHDVLPELAQAPDGHAVRGYLGDGDPRKRFELADRLARVFDRCLLYRPDWIREWERGAAPHWQARLWQRLAGDGRGAGEGCPAGEERPPGEGWSVEEEWPNARGRFAAEGQMAMEGTAAGERRATAESRVAATNRSGGEGRGAPTAHWVAAIDAFRERIGSGVRPPGWPRRAVFFAVSSLSPSYLEALRRAAEGIEIHLFMVVPCREYWGDIRSRREIARRDGGGDPDAGYFTEGNELLAAWGRAGRDTFDALVEGESVEWEEHFVPPDGACRLAAVAAGRPRPPARERSGAGRGGSAGRHAIARAGGGCAGWDVFGENVIRRCVGGAAVGARPIRRPAGRSRVGAPPTCPGAGRRAGAAAARRLAPDPRLPLAGARGRGPARPAARRLRRPSGPRTGRRPGTDPGFRRLRTGRRGGLRRGGTHPLQRRPRPGRGVAQPARVPRPARSAGLAPGGGSGPRAARRAGGPGPVRHRRRRPSRPARTGPGSRHPLGRGPGPPGRGGAAGNGRPYVAAGVAPPPARVCDAGRGRPRRRAGALPGRGGRARGRRGGRRAARTLRLVLRGGDRVGRPARGGAPAGAVDGGAPGRGQRLPRGWPGSRTRGRGRRDRQGCRDCRGHRERLGYRERRGARDRWGDRGRRRGRAPALRGGGGGRGRRDPRARPGLRARGRAG